MDKELWLKRRKLSKQLRLVDMNIRDIHDFLKKEECFKKKESIEAFQSIRTFLTSQKEKSNCLGVELKKVNFDLIKSCDHELIVKRDGFDFYECVLCGGNISKEDRKHSRYVVDLKNSYMQPYFFSESITEFLEKNDISSIEDHLEMLQNKYHIKVLRRW